MVKIKLEEITSINNYKHIDIIIFNLPLKVGFCNAKFKLILALNSICLEFRIAKGWPQMFLNWPGQTQDIYGPKFTLTIGNKLLSELNLLCEYDLEFLQCLVAALPDIVETALRESGHSIDVALSLTAAATAFGEEFKAALRQVDGGKQIASRIAGEAAYVETRLVDTLILTEIETISRLHAAAGQPDAAADGTPTDDTSVHPSPSWVELGLADTFLAYQNDTDRIFITSAVTGDAIRLCFPSVSGWLRVLSQVDRAGPFLRRFISSVEVHVRAPVAPATAAAIGIGFFDRTGGFRLAHTFCRNCPLPDGAEPLKFAVTRAALKRSLRDIEAGLPLFLFVEFDTAAEIEFALPIWLEGDPAGVDIPYRRSEQTACERLLMLNAQLRSHAEPRDRLHWLITETELALRFECLDTAISLLQLITPHCQHFEPRQRRTFLSLFVELAFVEDRRDDIRDRLILNFDLARTDDHLFTALSLCMSPEQEGEMFDRLPSGKPNRAYLSCHPAAAKALGLLAEAAVEDADGQLHLLAASLLRAASPGLYLKALNDFLARHDLAPLAAADAGAANVVASFRFAAIPRQKAGPKVSVIMAVYNAEETVSYSIRSILEQSHQEIELLVCDDCSCDASAGEIAGWRHDDRVRIFRSAGNQGPYNIRNALIPEASGAYITFQDADDLSHPERLHRQVQVLESGSAAAVFGHWIRIRPDGTIVFFRDHRCLRMSVVTFMASRELFERFGGYRNVLCGADTDFLERVRLELGPDAVIEIEQPLVFGLWSSRSLTRQPGLEATEHGFRSAARRRLAETAGRQRLLGRVIVPDAVVCRAAQEAGIYRPSQGVIAGQGT